MAEPEKKSRAQSSAVTGPALKALQAMQTEYATMHYHIAGTPKIVSEQVIRVLSKDRLLLGVCIDSSRVRVLDKAGKPVITPKAAARTMNFLTVVKAGTRWAVSQETFPANPSC